jgi:hypothetical protein
MLGKKEKRPIFIYFQLQIKYFFFKNLEWVLMGTHVCVRIVITFKSVTCINWNSGDCKVCGFKESSQSRER